MAEIQAERIAFGVLYAAFQQEVGAELSLWSGPGMVSYTIIQEMQATGERINTLGERYNRLAKAL